MDNNEDIKETTDILKQEKKAVLAFEYDVKNTEEDKAFTAFQKKYVYKHNWKVTIVFSVLVILFGISAIKYEGYLNIVLTFISAAMIFITWYNTFRIKKYLLRALKTLEDDRYIFTLYEDSFKIETVIDEEEKNSEDFVPIKPKIVRLDEDGLSVIEKSDMFILIIQKETIYVLPKRCIDEDDRKTLSGKLSQALKENYESEN